MDYLFTLDHDLYYYALTLASIIRCVIDPSTADRIDESNVELNDFYTIINY